MYTGRGSIFLLDEEKNKHEVLLDNIRLKNNKVSF